MKDNQWRYIISSKRKLIDFNFKEIWQYKDLLFLFVKRDVVTVYKQTILGPLWYLIQPLLTSVIFTIIFNGIANIDVGTNIHPFLFNLAGITIWNYFSECLKGTSNTFTKNQNIFGKVYFPRVILPLSIIVSKLIKFFIQFIIFIAFYIYFFNQDLAGELNIVSLVYLPVLIIVMGLLGLGLGMIISSLTTKYKDLTFLVTFGIQLLMYLSSVMYPTQEAVSKIKNNFPGTADYIIPFIETNPLGKVVEAFRYIFFSQGDFSVSSLMSTVVFALVVFLVGLVVFNHTEKKFIDTV